MLRLAVADGVTVQVKQNVDSLRGQRRRHDHDRLTTGLARGRFGSNSGDRKFCVRWLFLRFDVRIGLVHLFQLRGDVRIGAAAALVLHAALASEGDAADRDS